MEAGLKIQQLNKSFANLTIFQDFEISFREREINCILGPSGCGKTTLLDLLSGSVCADRPWKNDLSGNTLSYVFQEPRLLPWRTAEDNLIFSLRDILTKKELGLKIEKYLELVELKKFRNYFPAEMSGGMKQRLSLARAFSFPSDIILMDEPFKALDMKLKNNLMKRFRDLWQEDQRTVIFVTHDVDEALELGHTIQVLSGPPARIMNRYEIINNKSILRKEILELIFSS